MAARDPFGLVRGGIHAAVDLTPKASKAAIGPIAAGAEGAPVLKARVTAAPEKGKANAALCRMLATEWDLAPSQLSVVSGNRARRKTVRIEPRDGGAPEPILRGLKQWAKAQSDQMG